MKAIGRVLVIAGSDSGGGAGIQGDIKTITCLGGYATTAITALTAQNTLGVQAVYPVAPAFIARQITAVLDDIGADAIKTGMLHSAAAIHAIADTLAAYSPAIPLALDPVISAKGGSALLEADALDALKTRLIPRAALLTPNIPEAELLSGHAIHTIADMQAAAERLLKLGCSAVLIKGGHGEGDVLTDLLANASGAQHWQQARLHSRHTHGTGCALASAIATGLAQGMALETAILRARAYVREAIMHAPQLGHGHGPLGHNHNMAPFSW